MNDYHERLEKIIFIPCYFSLLINDSTITHESADRYRIVESKNLPKDVPIISGGIFTFFHNEIVRCLLEESAPISNVKRVYIWRKYDGFESDSYSTIEITNRLPFSEICTQDFEPLSINIVEENEVIFFSQDFVQTLHLNTRFILEKSPLFHLFSLA